MTYQVDLIYEMDHMSWMFGPSPLFFRERDESISSELLIYYIISSTSFSFFSSSIWKTRWFAFSIYAVIILSFWAEVHYNSIYPQGGKWTFFFLLFSSCVRELLCPCKSHAILLNRYWYYIYFCFNISFAY